MLCDAGGGTVVSLNHSAVDLLFNYILTGFKDVVSYRVNKVEPLELEKITIATSQIRNAQRYMLVSS